MLLILFCASGVSAHPISVTKNFVYVTRNQVSAKIDVFLEDLYLFHKLKPNDQDFLPPDVIRKGIELHKKFLLDKFVIRNVRGERLPGRIVEVKEFKLKPEGVPLAELMAHKLTFDIQYELPAPPEFLTFSQHLTDKDKIIPSVMNLVVKQENGGKPYQVELKPDEPDTVRFDWNNPPLSPEASEAERKQWLEKQKEETLGITSYSSVYSFLYIEDHEVRHEILIPLLTLEESVLIARDDDEFLDIAEQDAARQQIEAFFVSGNPIEIDGKPVKPTVQRCDFYGLDFKDFALQAKRRKVSTTSARVGIILVYPTKQPPETVKLTWNRFNQSIWSINMIVFAYEKLSRVTLSRLGKRNVFEWTSPGRPEKPALKEVAVEPAASQQLSLPMVALIGLAVLAPVLLLMKLRDAAASTYVVAIILAGLGVWYFAPLDGQPAGPDQEQAKSIFSQLHRNIYRAFDYRQEEEVYDALAKSTDGELLQDVYLQVRRGLEMQEQGGAVSRIRDIELIEGEQQPVPAEAADSERGFEYRCRWNVNGTVEHWGHIHARTNQYEAVFRVEPRANAWKITSMKLLDEKRVKTETNIRGL